MYPRHCFSPETPSQPEGRVSSPPPGSAQNRSHPKLTHLVRVKNKADPP